MRVKLVSEVVAREMARPYIYGQSDCFFLAIDVIDGIRGASLREKYADRYSSLKGAQKALRRAKCKSLVDLFKRELGDPIPASRAEIGDVAVCDVAGAEHMAVWGGSSWISRTERGQATFNHIDVKAAFKV